MTRNDIDDKFDSIKNDIISSLIERTNHECDVLTYCMFNTTPPHKMHCSISY